MNGQVRPCIARLNDDGSLDTGFDPGLGAGHVDPELGPIVFALANPDPVNEVNWSPCGS